MKTKVLHFLFITCLAYTASAQEFKQPSEGKSLVSCQGSNNGQSGVSFAESLRYKKPYIAMAMRVFCALTFHKIYGRLTHHLRVDTTLGMSPSIMSLVNARPGRDTPFR